MFWKYIEKINWKKDIQHIFLLKNKQLCISITYEGYFWECGLKGTKEFGFCPHGWRVEFTILGILFDFLFYDKRWYNENEGRFYLEDEPRWNECFKPDYLDLVKTFMQKHPELKEGYYERVVVQMSEDQKEFGEEETLKRKKENQRWKRGRQQQKKKMKEFISKLPDSFDVHKVSKAIWSKKEQSLICDRFKKCFSIAKEYFAVGFGLAKVYTAKWDGGNMVLGLFNEEIGGMLSGPYFLPEIIAEYDFYDKEGNLISKADDYKKHEIYSPSGMRWYLSDKYGNVLYEHIGNIIYF